MFLDVPFKKITLGIAVIEEKPTGVVYETFTCFILEQVLVPLYLPSTNNCCNCNNALAFHGSLHSMPKTLYLL